MSRQTYIKIEPGDSIIEAFYGTGSYNDIGEYGAAGADYALDDWTCPKDISTIDVLIVGGGGGGGRNSVNNNRGAGGGGGGGVRYLHNYAVTPDASYVITVGYGGITGSTDAACRGGRSSFNGVYARGGGGGAGASSDADGSTNRNCWGACSGGGGNISATPYWSTSPGGILPVSGSGYSGGWGHNDVCTGLSGGSGGGGGGMGEVATWPNAGLNDGTAYGGDGGDGVYYGDIFGEIYGDEGWFGGGGGGGTRVNSAKSDGTSTYPGTGGAGGGGNGGGGGSAPYNTPEYWGQNGMPHTGGGAGGSRYTGTASADPSFGIGGSGVVLVKYTVPLTSSAWRKCTQIWMKDSSGIWDRFTSPYIDISDDEELCMPILDASGGTVTTDGIWKYHTFNSSTNVTINTSGRYYVLVVGGGGASGSTYTGNTGGAGGGEVKQTLMNISTGTYAVVVGSGGPAGYGTASGKQGNSSSFNGITANGGYGSTFGTSYWKGASSGNFHPGGTYLNENSGGGGGDNENGGDGTVSLSGDGGDGTLSYITKQYYGGGGAGGYRFGSSGTGGLGGGGTANHNGTANTGGGAGGRAYVYKTYADGFAGGSGVVVIKYRYKNL